MTQRDYSELVSSLRGSYIIEIGFVRDYIQLVSSEWAASIFEPPMVSKDGVSIEFPERGSRDLLVSMVGAILLDVVVEEGARVVWRFSNGVEMAVPLNGENALKKRDILMIDIGSGRSMVSWVF